METLPDELSAAFVKYPAAKKTFLLLPPSHRKEHVKYVTEAVKSETRQRRAEKTIEFLLSKKK